MHLSAKADGLRRAVEELVDALLDPAQRERRMLWLLSIYAAIWTLYGALAKASQNLHFDMTELVGWSRELALGYPKHPPLAAYVVKLWFAVFPFTDWAYYLLAMVLAAAALWFAWRLAADYLDAEKRVAAVLLLTLIPFFNFHALKFNVNTVLMPVWAATTWWFLRSVETRKPLYAILAGVGAAAAMLGKYWSIVLLLGLALAVLLDSRRKSYFTSSAPYLTILAGAVVLAPHLVWLFKSDFSPITYAMDVHGNRQAGILWLGAVRYLLGALAYVAVPVILATILFRPSKNAVADMAWPQDAARRLVLFAFLAPLLIPIAGFFAGIEVTALWTMSAWTLLPVVLLSPQQVSVSRSALMSLTAIALVFPVVMTAAGPFIAFAIHKAGVAPAQAHARLLARRVIRDWRATTDKPLRLVGGDADLSYGVAFYLPSKPSAFPNLSVREAPWVNDTRVFVDGISMVCRAEDTACASAATARVKDRPDSRRREVTLTRKFFGVPGAPQRYLIVTLPPQPENP